MKRIFNILKELKIINFFSTVKSHDHDHTILPVDRQIDAWKKASEKMVWSIRDHEFSRIKVPPKITDKDRRDGHIDVILSYGFGDDGHGNADSVLSGKVAWNWNATNEFKIII